MDKAQLKFLETINSCVKHLELAEQLINIGDMYDTIKDYPDEIKKLSGCIETVESWIVLAFRPLLFPAIVQHIKNADDRLDLIYINPETQIIYYAEKKEMDSPEYWQIHIAEYDSIMQSATIIHKQFTGLLNPPQEPNFSQIMLEEISTVNIKNYKAWAQQYV